MHEPRVRILDATFANPAVNPRANFDAHRLPNAQFLNLKENFAKPDTQLPMMLCSTEQFCERMEQFDVRRDDHVVVYDSHIMFGCARSSWMFSLFGLEVSVLDGPIQKWIKDGYPIHTDETEPQQARKAASQEDFLFEKDDSKIFTTEEALSLGKDMHYLDSRFKPMHDDGNIPGSTSMPFMSLLNEDMSFKPHDQIVEEFKKVGVDKPESQPVVVGCQIGMGACILNLAMTNMGNTNTRNHDGSFVEFMAKGGQPAKNS